jgi:DNA methylase
VEMIRAIGANVSNRLPAHRNESVTVYLGDARDVMADMPDDSVDCVVTSPPYWALRDYGVAPVVWGGEAKCSHKWQAARRGKWCAKCEAWLGCLGLEPDPGLFVTHLVEIFREVRRLLKPTGSLWLNLGDCFYHACRGQLPEDSGLKPKDLIGIPWRAALALQKDGWYLRSDIIWHKPNPIPEPAYDRPVRAHEFLFLLTKQPQYHYDAEAVREPAVSRERPGSWPMPSLSDTKYKADQDQFVRSNNKYARRCAPQATDRHRRSVQLTALPQPRAREVIAGGAANGYTSSVDGRRGSAACYG